MFISITFIVNFLATLVLSENDELEEKYGVKYANSCEGNKHNNTSCVLVNNCLCFAVCKYFVIELENRLDETGKSHDVVETGYGLDESKKKRKKYSQSELRLVESLDGKFRFFLIARFNHGDSSTRYL